MQRYWNGDFITRTSLDKGGPEFKLVLNLIDKINALSPDRVPQLSGFHDSGVKGAYPIVIAPGLEESPEAIQVVAELIGLERVNYRYAADYKVQNMIVGIQAPSSTYACPICNCPIGQKDHVDCEGTLRTILRVQQKHDAG